MNRIFSLDSPVVQFFMRVGNLIYLNILWILCCIPVVTIGASTTALYRVTLDMAAKKESTIIIRFFTAFRENFKPATKVWLILLLPTAVTFMNTWLFFFGPVQRSIGMLLIWLTPLLALVAILSYVFPYVAMFEDKPLVTIRNAALLALGNFPRTILILVIKVAPFLVLWFFPAFFFQTSILWFLIGFSIIAFFISKLMLISFDPYLPQEEIDVESEHS